MNYLNDFLEDLTGSQILKNEKEEKERDKKWRIEKAKKCLNCRQVTEGEDIFRSISSPEADYIRDFCLWYSENVSRFVIEDNTFNEKGIGHITKLNILMIWDGNAVIENFRYIKYSSKKKSIKRNIFIISIWEGVLKRDNLSVYAYKEMRREALANRYPIHRYWMWTRTGRRIYPHNYWGED